MVRTLGGFKSHLHPNNKVESLAHDTLSSDYLVPAQPGVKIYWHEKRNKKKKTCWGGKENTLLWRRRRDSPMHLALKATKRHKHFGLSALNSNFHLTCNAVKNTCYNLMKIPFEVLQIVSLNQPRMPAWRSQSCTTLRIRDCYHGEVVPITGKCMMC